ADRRGLRANATDARENGRGRMAERARVRDATGRRGKVKRMAIALLTLAAALDAEDRFTQELEVAARVASVMVDGDACRRIVTTRAMDYLLRTDGTDRFLAGDNYEVNYIAFDAVKKTLIRISRLVSFPADANLWMPIPGHPDKIRVVIRNANELSQFWPWGAL